MDLATVQTIINAPPPSGLAHVVAVFKGEPKEQVEKEISDNVYFGMTPRTTYTIGDYAYIVMTKDASR